VNIAGIEKVANMLQIEVCPIAATRICLAGAGLFLAVAMSACSPASNTPQAATAGTVDIELADIYAVQRTGQPLASLGDDLRQQTLDDLQQLQATAAEVDVATNPKLQAELEILRLERLARAAAEQAGVFAPPTETEISEAYAAYVRQLPNIEYHVSQILVATKGLADVLVTRLEGGRDFAEIASDTSADASSDRGGDLGWIASGKLPGEFMAAVEALEPGEFTRRPVHTAYGWHLIKLHESRPVTPPSLEQVRAQLAAQVQQQRYERFLAGSVMSAGR
jgi:peptidyl-prolyl cis-trans isomerase C